MYEITYFQKRGLRFAGAASAQVKGQPTEQSAETLRKKLEKKIAADRVAELEAAVAAFNAAPAAAPGGAAKKEFRLASQAAIATWNGDFTAADWDAFLQWFVDTAKAEKIWRWTVTMEESLHAQGGVPRVHFHAMMEWQVARDDSSVAAFMYKNSHPNFQQNYMVHVDNLGGAAATGKRAPRGHNVRQSLDAGLRHFLALLFYHS